MSQVIQCYDDPRIIFKQQICLVALSKDMKGQFLLREGNTEVCSSPPCQTLKTIHEVSLQVEGHQQCDDPNVGIFNGHLAIKELVTAFDKDGLGRGFHAGDFEWNGAGAWGSGRISGVTNAGTHRDPVISNCQRCYAPGFMEGRICGHFDRADVPSLQNVDLVGTYCFRYKATEKADSSHLAGVIEAVIIARCG